MSGREIVELKKQIHHLKEHNTELKDENQEHQMRIGELEKELLKMRNVQMYLNLSKANQNKEMLRRDAQEIFIQEKEKTRELEEQNKKLYDRIALLEKQVKDREGHIQSLQKENVDLKKQLIDFSNKHEAKDFIDELNNRKDIIRKKEEESQRKLIEMNELYDKMEKVIYENRVLRQIADVPENFGINIEKIKLGDREKIEDYKAKIRLLRQEVDDLETERAQLKHKLLFISSTMASKEKPFSSLTPEQRLEVARYAQELLEGKREIPETTYELKKTIQDLQNQLELLQNNSYPGPMSFSVINKGGKGRIRGSQIGSAPNFAGFGDDIEKLKEGQQEIMDLIRKGGTIGGFGGFTINSRNYQTGGQNQPKGQEMVPYLDLGIMQLPAIPLRNFSGELAAGSYRFNTPVRIEKTKIDSIFGICDDEKNPDKLQMESAALQSQIIELLEVEARRNKNDESLNENLKNLYGKFEKICLIQNEVFYRYMELKKSFNEMDKKNDDQIKEFNVELEILRKDNIRFRNEMDKRRNGENAKYIDSVKEIAILEAKLIRLQRKYDCLFEEEQKKSDHLREKEETELEKDKMFKDVVARLKQWKNMLMCYLKIVMKKLRNSVDKQSFEKIAMENKFLREKNNELVYQDLSLTKILCVHKNLRNEYKRLEEEFYECEELKLDSQIDLNYLRKRISEIDPTYKLEQNSFKKLTRRINELNLTYSQLKKVFCNVQTQSRAIAQNDDEGANEGGNRQELIKRTEHILEGLSIDNSVISKEDFKSGLIELRITKEYLSEEDLKLIYRYLNCEEIKTVDIRSFLKKLEQFSMSDLQAVEEDKDLLFKFIECVKNSGQNLLTTFGFFDTNNNGYITREEFKFALNQMKFPILDETIDKLILLVTEESIDKFVLNESDTFNYREFCQLFEQKSNNLQLKKRKVDSSKINFRIDWKTNILTAIVNAINSLNISTYKAIEGFDRGTRGFLSFHEFSSFIDNLNARGISRNDKEKIFAYFAQSREYAPIQIIIDDLERTKEELKTYNDLTGANSEGSAVDIQKKYYLVQEEKGFLNYKVNQLQKKIAVLEQNNSDVEKEMESFRTKNEKLIKKYFDEVNKLQEYTEKYVDSGITRGELRQIEDQNDQLAREVNILRIGLNTFKELYNSANHQNKYMHINNCINADELETYKKAIKELQGENNQNALIGKLYYTILLSRWREANISRKFDEFSLNFSAMKEDNFQMQIQNQTLTKDLTDITASFHDKVIENLVISDELDNYRNGFITSDNREFFQPFDDMKRLIKTLTEEKITLNENILKLKKENILLENQKNELNSQVTYAQELESKIRFENNDQYTKKLIQYCDEISKLKLSDAKNKREKDFHMENEQHLDKLKGQLEDEVRKLEEENATIEGKLRKLEDVFKAKDDERQKKIIEALEKMKIYSKDEINNIYNYGTLPNTNNNLRGGKPKPGEPGNTYPNYSEYPPQKQQFMTQYNNSVMENSKINEPNEEDYSKYSQDQLVAIVQRLNNILRFKDKEIEKLNRNLDDFNAKLEQTEKFYSENSIPNLVGETGYRKIRDDDAQMLAETAQKTIKTLQDMLNQKNSLLVSKDKEIDKLNNENQQMKVDYLKQIATLNDQIKSDHDSTMKKLGNIIDNSNPNLVMKMSRSDLSILTLNDLEKLINEKDNAIKALATELKINQEEKDTIYFELGEKNKRIFQLEDEAKLNKLKQGNNANKGYSDSEMYKKNYEDKLKEIEKERENLEKMKIEFANKLEQANAVNVANLDNTSYVPERLVVNKEKSDLYVKIDQLRRKNTKLTEEKKKMLKEKEEFEAEKQKLNDKINKVQTDSKVFQECQLRDMKKLSKLNKENDKLKKEKEELQKQNDYLKSENQKLKQERDYDKKEIELQKKQNKRISQQQSSLAQSQSQPKISNQPAQEQFSQSSQNWNLSQNAYGFSQPQVNKPDLSKSKPAFSSGKDPAQERLEKLVYYCLNKKINLLDQLKRYDLSGSGKITTDEFRKSIDELKLGFITNDLELLEKAANAYGGLISIDNFVELTKKVDPNYKEFIESSLNNRNFDNKTTKKYNPFENKNYNINY